MANPLNPLDWLSVAQDWFAKTEKSSGFRPYLIYMILCMGIGLLLLTLAPDSAVVQTLGAMAVGIPIVCFVPLFAWKAARDPDFCRSETHVQRVKKIELEMMGSDSKQITADVLDRRTLEAATKEPLLIEVDDARGAE